MLEWYPDLNLIFVKDSLDLKQFKCNHKNLNELSKYDKLLNCQITQGKAKIREINQKKKIISKLSFEEK